MKMEETTEDLISDFMSNYSIGLKGKELIVMKSQLEYLVLLAKMEQLKENQNERK